MGESCGDDSSCADIAPASPNPRPCRSRTSLDTYQDHFCVDDCARDGILLAPRLRRRVRLSTSMEASDVSTAEDVETLSVHAVVLGKTAHNALDCRRFPVDGGPL